MIRVEVDTIIYTKHLYEKNSIIYYYLNFTVINQINIIMNTESLTLVFGLMVASIVVAAIIIMLFVVITETIDNYRNRCQHSNRYFDGDTMSIKCSDCNAVVTSIGNKMTIEEFVNQ